MKRIIDIGLSITLIILFSPIFILISLMIKLNSKGKIFYSSIRVGKENRRFVMWKFRTMVENADEDLDQFLEDNPDVRAEWYGSQKLQKDPRVTKLGEVLRVWSLDELPQFWNVLNGEMSLVGPRPIIDQEITRYGDLFPDYIRVRPGITGLWQVSGRSRTTYQERIELDYQYLQEWTIRLDIYILIRTIPVVLNRTGAY